MYQLHILTHFCFTGATSFHSFIYSTYRYTTIHYLNYSDLLRYWPRSSVGIASVDLFRRSWVQTQTCALISISLETSYSCLWFQHFSHSIKTGIALDLDGTLCCDHWPLNSVTSFLPCTCMSIKRRFT